MLKNLFAKRVPIFKKRDREGWLAVKNALKEEQKGRFLLEQSLAEQEAEQDRLSRDAEIYQKLALDGFAEARPRFEAYAESQKNYKKNRLVPSPRLIRKINHRLDFYFAHYGYDMMEDEEE